MEQEYLPEVMELAQKFVVERERVRVLKESGAEKPWTEWEPLQKFRFTNVRHRDDRVTKWLLENWYVADAPKENLVVAAAAARFINLPESLAEIGFPEDLSTFPSHLEKVLLDRQARGETMINSAYLIRGFEGMKKATSIAERWIRPLCENPPTYGTESLQKFHTKLSSEYAGLGSFLSGQVVIDLHYVTPGNWEDRYNWAAQGPGSSRCLAAMWGERPKPNKRGRMKFDKSMKPDEFARRFGIFREGLLLNPEVAKIVLEKDLIAHDMQNVLCETFKLWRYFELGYRPKNSYRGT